MEGVDGIDLLRHIRSDAACKHIPVVSEPPFCRLLLAASQQTGAERSCALQ